MTTDAQARVRLLLLAVAAACYTGDDDLTDATADILGDLEQLRGLDLAAGAVLLLDLVVKQVAHLLAESPSRTVERLGLMIASADAWPPEPGSETRVTPA